LILQTRTNVIVGGEDATKGYYPWQAAIYYGEELLCGGSLIGNKHILTAAHCFKGLSKDLSLYKVVLGDTNRDEHEGKQIIWDSNVMSYTRCPQRLITLLTRYYYAFFYIITVAFHIK